MSSGFKGKGVDRLLRANRDLHSSSVQVGIVKSQKRGTGSNRVEMGAVYFWVDQGTRSIPPRKTLEPALKDFKDYPALTRGMFSSAVRGSIRNGLNRVGVELSEAVKKEVRRLRKPVLARSTLSSRRKRGNTSDKPLIDTGMLVKAIDYKVNL